MHHQTPLTPTVSPTPYRVRVARTVADVHAAYPLARHFFGDNTWPCALDEALVARYPGGLLVLETQGEVVGYADLYDLTWDGARTLRADGEHALTLDHFRAPGHGDVVYWAGIAVWPGHRAGGSALLTAAVDARLATPQPQMGLAESPAGVRLFQQRNWQPLGGKVWGNAAYAAAGRPAA